MDYNRIDAALRHANDTRHLLIGTGILNDVGNVLEQAFGQQPAVVVADDNTYAIAGKALCERLRSTGCPTEPAEIGVSVAQLRESYILARTIRSRYTVLDLVNESCILDACVDELFAPGGYWAAIPHA